MKLIDIEVMSDYDDHFLNLVKGWILRKNHSGELFKHQKIIISAGPWRPYAVHYESSLDPDTNIKTLEIDFYAALRAGFGQLSEQDVNDLINLL